MNTKAELVRTAPRATRRQRSPYVTPRLTKLASVAELTLGHSLGGGDGVSTQKPV